MEDIEFAYHRDEQTRCPIRPLQWVYLVGCFGGLTREVYEHARPERDGVEERRRLEAAEDGCRRCTPVIYHIHGAPPDECVLKQVWFCARARVCDVLTVGSTCRCVFTLSASRLVSGRQRQRTTDMGRGRLGPG